MDKNSEIGILGGPASEQQVLRFGSSERYKFLEYKFSLFYFFIIYIIITPI